jgi:hypothetical protein
MGIAAKLLTKIKKIDNFLILTKRINDGESTLLCLRVGRGLTPFSGTWGGAESP